MPRVLSEKHKAALADGRRRRAAERAAEKDAHRIEFKEWCDRDADRWAAFLRGDITRDERLAASRLDPMPALYGEAEEC
jgi:hypothetical protein